MNLTYFANLRLPTEKAHGLQIIKTCAAFAKQGVQVKLVIPHRKQVNPHLTKIKDPFTYYQVTTRFPIVKLPCLDLLFIRVKLPQLISHWPFYLQELTFTLSCLIWSLLQKHPDLYYTRTFSIAALFSLFYPQKVAFELHNLPSSPLATQFYQHTFPHIKVIAINKYLKTQAQKLGAAKAHSACPTKPWRRRERSRRVILAPDAASPEDFHLPTQTTARKQLNLPLNQKIILYTGSFEPIKGVYTLIKASQHLDPKTHTYLLGGSHVDRQITPLKQFTQNNKLKNVHIIDHFIPHPQLSLYRAAADILVIPNSANDPHPKLYTSPLKLFQYLASGRPIIASRVPAIQEIVSEKEVFFFTPDHPQSLAKSINQVLKHPKLARIKTQAAQKLAHHYTWTRRAQVILKSSNQKL